MRPIYWGLVLYLAGIFLSILLGFVAFLQKFCMLCPGGVPHPSVFGVDPFGHLIQCQGKSPPSFYIGLIYIVRFAMLFSLPFAVTIEVHRLLKDRKGETKEVE